MDSSLLPSSFIQINALTKKELLEFSSSHHPNNLVFDFSRIPETKYIQILASLVHNSKKDFKALTFCLDLYNEVYEVNASIRPQLRNEQSIKGEPTTLANSAFRKDETTLQALVIALKYILPRTQTLEYLEFRNIPFTYTQIQKLGNSIAKCTPLKYLAFDNIPLNDEGFVHISKSIKKLKIISLKCKTCNLTDLSSPSVKTLLSAGRVQKFSRSESGLLNLDLRYNSFSYRFLLEIGDLLSRIPLKILDLRFNQMIDTKIAKNMKSVIHGLDIRVNSMKTKKTMYDSS